MRRRLPLCCAMALWLTACSLSTILEPRKDLSQFYVLTPIGADTPSAPLALGNNPKSLAIGLGPVKLPAYLARPEIITRSGPNKIDLSDRNRWAEPLDKNFSSVLGQNLTTLLGARVVTFPWYRPAKLDYQITDDVSRFDTDSQGTAQLTGRWEIKDPDTGAVLNSGVSNINLPAQSGETPAATLSRALGDLSRQLADAVRATRPPAPRPGTD